MRLDVLRPGLPERGEGGGGTMFLHVSLVLPGKMRNMSVEKNGTHVSLILWKCRSVAVSLLVSYGNKSL